MSLTSLFMNKSIYILFIAGLFLTNIFSVNAQNENRRIQDLDSILIAAIKSTHASDYQEALKGLQHLNELATERNAIRYQILANLNYGNLYYRLNESENSLNYTLKALDLSLENNDEEFLNSIYNNLGIVYSRNMDNEKALSYYEKALEFSIKQGKRKRIGYNLLNIGNVYKEIEDYESSLDYYYQACEIFKEVNDDKTIAIAYGNIGSVYGILKNYDKAVINLRKSIGAGISKDKFYLSDGQFNLGKMFYYSGEYDSSLFYLHKSLDNALEIDNKEIVINTYYYLAKTYQEYGYVNKALMYYKKSSDWKDSLLTTQSKKWISEMQMKYEFGKKEQEVEFLKQRNKLNRIILIITLSAIFLFLILIIYVMRNRSVREKQRNELLYKEKELAETRNKSLQEELEHKNRELSSQAMHVINKNSILTKIRELIQNISRSNIQLLENKLNEVDQLIESNVSLDDDWETFKMHFEKVHTDFFTWLYKNYPGLTQNDIRLCAYLVINLNINEMADILGISPDSVRKRRQRLRTKLDLPQDTDIHEFLSCYNMAE